MPKRLLLLALAGASLLLAPRPAAAQRMYWAEPSTTPRIRSARLDGTDVQDLLTNAVERPNGVVIEGGQMYWVDTGGVLTSRIQRARLDGSGIENLVSGPNLSPPVLDTAAGQMYWTEGSNSIRRAGLDGSNPQVLITGLEVPVRPILDVAGGKIYWTAASVIQRANLDGSGLETLAVTGIGFTFPVYLSLDLAAGKMYWMDDVDMGLPGDIKRANLDGSQVETVVPSATVSSLSPVALDVAGGKMYWADASAVPRVIRRANLDGSGVETVVNAGIGLPTSPLLDLAGGRLYWSDALTARIQSANLDGSNPQEVVTTGLAGVSLAFNPADGRLYWSNDGSKSIERVEGSGAGRETVIAPLLRRPGSIALDTEEGRLYWGDSGRVYRARLDGSDVALVASTGSNLPPAVAFDPVGGKLYWTVPPDVVPSPIRRADRDGGSPEDVVASASAAGLAVDGAGGKVYWTDPFSARVRRASLDGSSVQDVAVEPVGRSVVVDPVAGKLYWAGLVAGTRAGIRRANLDGSGKESLDGFGTANGLDIDRATHQLYWTASNFEPGRATVARTSPSGFQTLVRNGIVQSGAIAVNVPRTPLIATGQVNRDPAGGLDAFARVFETAPAATATGRVGSRMGAVKDVDVDPTTGRVYTIDLVAGNQGQQVYVVDPTTGAGTPLPNPTGLPPSVFIWGLAFDASGTLYGGGLGTYLIDKATGRATPLAGLDRVPALIFGLAAAPGGTGFVSTGLLLGAGTSVPYVGRHGADGTFVPGSVLPVSDPQGRVLFDIAYSSAGVLYGNAVPASVLGGGAPAPETIRRVLDAPGVHSDLVLVRAILAENRLVAGVTSGAPLDALLLGLGRTLP
jgi:sugar lactone lactonase YvrE